MYLLRAKFENAGSENGYILHVDIITCKMSTETFYFLTHEKENTITFVCYKSSKQIGKRRKSSVILCQTLAKYYILNYEFQ